MGESPILAELEIARDGKGVQVEFTKIDGIISHTISLVIAGGKTSVLTSRINELAQPCFTELHQQGDVLFLTGADGPCHWSMSVQIGKCESLVADFSKPDTGLFDFDDRLGLNAPSRKAVISTTRQILIFDVACRSKAPVNRLHSEYLAEVDLESAAFEGQKVQSGLFVFPHYGLLLLGSNPSSDTLTFQPEPRCLLEYTSKKLEIFSPSSEPELFPATVRWSYGVLPIP